MGCDVLEQLECLVLFEPHSEEMGGLSVQSIPAQTASKKSRATVEKVVYGMSGKKKGN